MLSTYRVAVAPEVRVQVADLGLACCAMEVDSAVRLGLLEPVAEEGAGASGHPGGATVLVVAGTVTDPLVPAVHAAVASCGAGGSVAVLAFGACASTGGPYWDAPTVVNGVDRLVPVAAYLPGCPPRPDALVEAVLAAAGVAEPRR